jgi:hypothetical protein
MKIAVILLFCLVLTVAATAYAGAGPVNTAQGSANASPQQELINTQRAFLGAMERGDAEYVKNAVADDFMVIETNGDSSGKRELVHGVHSPEHPGPAPILYDFKVVQLDSDCAVVSYNAVFHGTQLDRYQHLSDTWVKHGGQWKLKFQQTTLNLWSAHDLD